MSQQGAHSYEDKLLEFAYGELPSVEARSVEAHVKGCAKCAGALDSIRGVRRTMAALEPEPAPEAGLESLLAYAGQAARRIQAGPAPSNLRLRRWIFSLAGVASLAVLGIVASQVTREVNPLAQKEMALAEQRREQNGVVAMAAEPPPAAPAPVSQAMPQAAAPDEGATPPAEEAQAPQADRMDKLADMGNVTEGGRSTLPSAGPSRKAGSKGAFDTRDYTQRLAKPYAPAKKKAVAKSDLDSSGWASERLQYKEGGGSPGGSTDLPARELEGKLNAAPAGELEKKREASRRVTLPLQTASKDAYAQAESPADAESGDELDALLGGTETRAPAASPPAKSAPEEPRGELAASAPASQPTSMGTDTRQRATQVVTRSAAVERSSERAPAKSEREGIDDSRSVESRLRSHQEKLRAEIDATAERSKLIGLYSELCDVELQLGLYQPESCQHIVQKFSGTNAALLARSRLESQRQAYERRMLDEERAKKASEAVPASKQ